MRILTLKKGEHVVGIASHLLATFPSFPAVDPVTPSSAGLPGVSGLHTLMGWLMLPMGLEEARAAKISFESCATTPLEVMVDWRW